MRSLHGNVLFLVLIAVALFAALSYAVTQSGRGGGTTDKEAAIIMAAQISQEVAAIQTAVTRMVLTGTNKADLEFMPNTLFDLCSTGVNCVFSPEGGGARMPDPPPAAFSQDMTTGPLNTRAPVCDPYNPFGICLFAGQSTAVDGIGTTAPDVVISYLSLTKEVCMALNKGLGISGIPVEASLADPLLDAAPGEPAACILRTGRYDYYHVLVEY